LRFTIGLASARILWGIYANRLKLLGFLSSARKEQRDLMTGISTVVLVLLLVVK
jgi:hypothetical protein